MKHWYIGIDGGGTKTAFLVADQEGKITASFQTTGCSHTDIGIDAVVSLISKGVHHCLTQVNAVPEACAGICLGLSCYGENMEMDQTIAQALKNALFPIPICIVNDVEVGWAGALECRPGIHLVSGTGSIAFGKNRLGEAARCGGWNEFFGDEGSCYWLGREAMGLYSKEADGRGKQGPLYTIIREAFSLQEDMDFIPLAIRDILPYRDRVAAFQKYAYQAALAGDQEAIRLYDRAAAELAAMVPPLKEKLGLTGPDITVSYSGGLFQTGGMILTPLSRRLEELGCTLVPPKRSPVEGALLMAWVTFHQHI